VAQQESSEAGRLEYPQYTRPRAFRGLEVPDILLSGNHQAIARWRREQSEARSRRGMDLSSERSMLRKKGDHEESTPDPG
jgi:tRNA (guanine-N1)-methyltransferase